MTANAASLVKLEQKQNHEAIDFPDGQMYDEDYDARRQRHDTRRTATSPPPSEMTAEERGCDRRPDRSPHLLKQGAGREKGRAGAAVTKESHGRVAGVGVGQQGGEEGAKR